MFNLRYLLVEHSQISQLVSKYKHVAFNRKDRT